MGPLIRIILLVEIALICLTTTVDSGCPAGYVNQDLEEDTINVKFMMACVGSGSSLTAAIKHSNGERNAYHTVADGTSCEIGAQNVFYLRRITFWTMGASSVRVQVKQDNFNTGPIVIDEELTVSDSSGGTRHMFTIQAGFLPPPIGQPDVISFRLTFEQDDDAEEMQVRRLFARTCVGASED